jgi:hypothetical protein
MNPEIFSIVEDMRRRCKENPIAESDKQTYLMVQSSRLSVLLAEAAETQNQIVAEQTKETVRLTGSIHILTWVMVAVWIIQIAVAVIKS